MDTKREDWKKKFFKKLKPIHKNYTDFVVNKLLLKLNRVRNGLVSRSKKYKVPCTITIEDLRQMLYSAYGEKCKFCDKEIQLNNSVFDHIIPISKGGPSTRENLSVICSCCNKVKGSLHLSDFLILMTWLKTQEKDFAENIRIRLAGGKK